MRLRVIPTYFSSPQVFPLYVFLRTVLLLLGTIPIMQKQYSWTQEGGGDVIEVRGLFLREMLAEKGSNKKGQTPLVVDG